MDKRHLVVAGKKSEGGQATLLDCHEISLALNRSLAYRKARRAKGKESILSAVTKETSFAGRAKANKFR